MCRRVVIWGLAGSALTVAILSLVSLRTPLILYGRPGLRPVIVLSDGWIAADVSWSARRGTDTEWRLPGLRCSAWSSVGPAARGRSGGLVQTDARVELSLWIPFLLLVAYPSTVLARKRLSRAYRHARRRCSICDYDLHGNTSGICPECGASIDAWILPRWERVVIALLGSILANWVVEFVSEQIAFPYRLTVWLLRNLGSDLGSWMLPSLIRSVLVCAAALAVYIYLSPERFGESERGGPAAIDKGRAGT